MKAKLFLLIACVAMILAGCEPNTSIVNNSADGCLVSLTGSGFRLKSISIKNKNSHVVGTGSFLADYIVPEDGSVVVDLEYYCEYYFQGRERRCGEYHPLSFEIGVESAKSLEIEIVAVETGGYVYYDEVQVYVNGLLWKTLDFPHNE